MSPRELLPKTGAEQPPAREPSRKPERKRARHTACNRCKEKREKCSGERPQCETCRRTDTQCLYEAPPGVTRQQARKRKIEQSLASGSNLRDVIALLRHGSNSDAAAALNSIRQAEDIDAAVDTLAVAQALMTSRSATSSTENLHSYDQQSHKAARGKGLKGAWGRRITSPAEHAEHVFESNFSEARNQYNETDTFIDLPVLHHPISRWTSVCQDDQLMTHLYTLFWRWDSNAQPSVFRPMFEADLIEADPANPNQDRHTFCSPFLANALLALGCLCTTERSTFSDPDDLMTRGRSFAGEARIHWEKEKTRPSIPLMQGQFAMFIYEGNLGSGTTSVDYFMRAMNTYAALNNADFLDNQDWTKSALRIQNERHAMSWVMWGFYCTEWRASQAFGFRKPTSKPVISKLWQDNDFPLRQTTAPDYWWYPYPTSLRTQRSMKIEIRDVDCHLTYIAEDLLDYLYPLPDSLSDSPTSDISRGIRLYDELVNWQLSLPVRLRLEDAVQPHAILLHSHVECLLVAVLRPFLLMTEAEFGPFDPKARCYAHCGRLMDTIWTYRAFASLNVEYWYTHTLATIAFIIFRDHAESSILRETLTKACKYLHELTAKFPLAADSLTAIRGAFKLASLPVPVYLQPFMSKLRPSKDRLLSHTVARLPPGDYTLKTISDGEELKYLQLLDELDDLELD